MSNYNTTLQSNNTDLQSILDTINELPEAGISLPTLTSSADASKILIGNQAIDSEGNIINGTMPNNGAISATFNGLTTTSYTVPAGYTTGGIVSLDNTINNEVDEQADLIAQIKSAVDNLPEAGGGGSMATATVTINGNYGTTFRYVGIDGLTNIQYHDTTNIQVVVPSICYIKANNSLGFTYYSVSGDCSTLFSNNLYACVEITGDADIIAISRISSSDGSAD